MTKLEQFEESGKEVYQVTQKEWVEIMEDQHVNVCNRSQEEFDKYIKQEVQLFHKEQVFNALKDGIEISEEVLKDYPDMTEKLKIYKRKQAEKESIPTITKEIISNFSEGDKITIDGHYKVTLHKKENDSIICKIYRKQKQAIILSIGDRHTLSKGWNK